MERWFAELECGRTSTEDAESSGRPNEVVTSENIKKARKIILDNPKVKLQEIADIMKMSKGGVFTILHEHLSVRKLFKKGAALTYRRPKTTARRCLGGVFGHFQVKQGGVFPSVHYHGRSMDSPLYAGI